MEGTKTVNLILKYICNNKQTELDSFVNDVSKRDFIEFSSLEEVNAFFTDYLAEFYNNNSIDDIDNIVPNF